MNRISDKTYEDFYNELFNEIKLKIATELDDHIITQPTEDLVNIYMNIALDPIKLDPDQQESIEHKKFIKTIYSHERERGYQQDGDLKIECENIIVKIPIQPNNKIDKILKLRTNSISLSGGPQFEIEGNYIVITVEMKGYGRNLSNEKVRDVITSNRSDIQRMLQSKNAEIMIENSNLETRLTLFINERKNKLDADKNRINDLVSLVKIPLARKDCDIIKQIPVNKKSFIAKIKPKTPNEDYQLDRVKVLDIIKLLNNQCLQFEKTPKTYKKFDEPNLRDLLLSNLNSIFEGNATGETFNNKGKTDIYLNIDNGNILVTECKFYGGKKLYHQTIQQLLGYLTWRQNYGIMLTFCSQKNFSKILDEAETNIKSHYSFEGGFQKLYPAHFMSKHNLPGDDYKYVEIHHLFYNLYSENN